MSKADLAIEKKYNEKCNCAQAVACSFAKEAGVDEETLKAATQAFGVGLATMEGNCGALSGAAMVLGLINKDRKKTTGDIRAIMTEFKETYGTVVCKELKGVDTGKVITASELRPNCWRNRLVKLEDKGENLCLE